MSKNRDVLFGSTLGERIAMAPPALSNNWYNVQKFGYNGAVGSSAYETIWDGGGVYAYAGTPGTAAVTSDDTDDNTGTVQVFGLDDSYNLKKKYVYLLKNYKNKINNLFYNLQKLIQLFCYLHRKLV